MNGWESDWMRLVLALNGGHKKFEGRIYGFVWELQIGIIHQPNQYITQNVHFRMPNYKELHGQGNFQLRVQTHKHGLV